VLRVHPLRAIRPLHRRPGNPPDVPIWPAVDPTRVVFLALVGGYLLGDHQRAEAGMELRCNMALRCFVGLNLDQDAWDASTFSQNRPAPVRRVGVLEHLCDDTIRRAMAGSW
jgi:hypothetical protein